MLFRMFIKFGNHYHNFSIVHIEHSLFLYFLIHAPFLCIENSYKEILLFGLEGHDLSDMFESPKDQFNLCKLIIKDNNLRLKFCKWKHKKMDHFYTL
jgi:hypothetical protein